MTDERILSDEAWDHAELIVAGGWQVNDPSYLASRKALRADRAALRERVAMLEAELAALREVVDAVTLEHNEYGDAYCAYCGITVPLHEDGCGLAALRAAREHGASA